MLWEVTEGWLASDCNCCRSFRASVPPALEDGLTRLLLLLLLLLLPPFCLATAAAVGATPLGDPPVNADFNSNLLPPPPAAVLLLVLAVVVLVVSVGGRAALATACRRKTSRSSVASSMYIWYSDMDEEPSNEGEARVGG